MTNVDPLSIETLLEAGADAFAVNRKGFTPLDVVSSVDSQLQVTIAPSAQAAATVTTHDCVSIDEHESIPSEELAPLARHLNKKNRQAKRTAHACDALFLALYFSNHTATVSAIITAIKQNGLIVYVPKYDFRAPVYLRDRSGVVQINPSLLGVRIVDTDPATGAFAGAACIRQIPQAQLIWDETDREALTVVAPGNRQAVFRILDEVEVQVSCDHAASRARMPQLQLLLIGRANAKRKQHDASSLSELQQVVQTKNATDCAPNFAVNATQLEFNTAQDAIPARNLYQVVSDCPCLSPPTKRFARRNPRSKEEEGKTKNFNLKRRGPGRLAFGDFATNSRRHYQHKLAKYMDGRTEAREEELTIQRFATRSSAKTLAQEARRAERDALIRKVSC